MRSFKNKSIWLIGASEGLGREVARLLNAEGAKLFLSARNETSLRDLCHEMLDATPLPLDVTNAESIRSAYALIEYLDVIIYNAGAYDPMPTLNWDTDKALRMIDVNLNGCLRAVGEVLPDMLANRSGHIVLIGSLSAYGGLPKAIGYGASKAAVASIAETMRHDLKGTGVEVQLINPGFIKTRLTDKNNFKMPQLLTPINAAKHVIKGMRKNTFRYDFPWPFSGIIKLFTSLPDFIKFRT
jgi:NADP-dependent 3-hydroxy acid dehydrogenase YdfG